MALFAIAGAGFAVAAFARLDCDLAQQACSNRFDAGDLSWHTSLHLWMSLVVSLALIGTALAIARALWPSPRAALALAAGVAGLVILGLGWFLYDGTGAPEGIVDRVQLVLAQLWLLVVAAGVLHETRGAPRLAAPTPLRPRDFFGSSWAGEGQVHRATFGNGRVEERLRFARIVDPAHIRVTSDDLPDGVDVRIDDAGYRTAPYRALVPIGPLRFIVACRDEASLEPDGSLTYRVYASRHGLPVGRLDMRGRPVDDVPMAGARTAEATT